MLKLTWPEMKEFLARPTFQALYIRTQFYYMILGTELNSHLYATINIAKDSGKDQIDFEKSYRDTYKWV